MVPAGKNCKGDKMKKRTLAILALILVCLLAACSTAPQAEDPSKHADPEENQSVLKSPAGDDVTPYTFLNLICGNAEVLSFTYATEHADSNPVTFQKTENASVESYAKNDMHGNPVSVRELEKDGKVHYIMDDFKIIKTYLAPAEDFLFYKMLEAADSVPGLTAKVDGHYLYEYGLPFEHDENTQDKYSFYMKDGTLKKLTISLGDTSAVTYRFSDFRQELIDAAALEFPQKYDELEFSYPYTGEHVPPWWEIGNDE